MRRVAGRGGGHYAAERERAAAAFHFIFLDGIYTRGADDRLSFRRVVPHTEDIERLVDAQSVIQQASLLGQAALGDRAGKRARRVQVLGGRELPLPPRCASFAGYSLHAGVGFKATDRAGLERLCRYILRPPLAKDRLQRREDGNVVVGLKRVWSDGTSALVFSPSELVERLVALVPPPRANQVFYRGVVAANSAWRAEVFPSPPPEPPETAKARRAKRLTRHPRMRLAGEHPSWNDLLERVFRVGSFASSTGSAARPAHLGSTPRATTGRRDDAGPGRSRRDRRRG
jgi:hypothetical protein